MRISILIGLGLVLTAAGSPDEELGASVRHNIEAQVVDMNPKYDGTLMEGGIGQRSAASVRRYMTDKIRPLAKVDGRSEVGQQGGLAKSGDPTSGGK